MSKFFYDTRRGFSPLLVLLILIIVFMGSLGKFFGGLAKDVGSSAVKQAVSGGIGSVFSAVSNRQNFLYQKKLMDYDAQLQRRLQHSSVSDTAASYRQAGLNPAMMSGATPQSVSIPGGGSQIQQDTNSKAGEMSIVDEQRKNIQSSTDVNEATAAKVNAEKEGIEIDNRNRQQNWDTTFSLRGAQSLNLFSIANYHDKLSLKENYSIDNERINNMILRQTWPSLIDQAKGTAKLILQNAAAKSLEFKYMEKQIQMNFREQESRIGLNNASAVAQKQLAAIYYEDAFGKGQENDAMWKTSVVLPTGEKTSIGMMRAFAQSSKDYLDIKMQDVREQYERGQLTKQEYDNKIAACDYLIRDSERRIQKAVESVQGNKWFQWGHAFNSEFNILSGTIANGVGAYTGLGRLRNESEAVKLGYERLNRTVRSTTYGSNGRVQSETYTYSE